MARNASNAQAARRVAALLARFHQQRPIRAGSLLVSIFGDAIAPRGGAVTLAGLIALAAPFGISERHVRTAVGRLAQEGWFSARRAGRLAEYRLTELGAERFHEATQRIYGRNPAGWDRQWSLLLLGEHALRDDARRQLHWLGFGQLQPGVFIHPNSELTEQRQWLQELRLDDSSLLRSRSEGLDADRRLVARGWDLQQLARGYRRFVNAFAPLQSSPAAALCPREQFIVRTLLIHDYRKIHLQDPLLPPSLLPHDWIGSAAYELCAALYGQVFPGAEEFLSGTAGTISEPLPPPVPMTYQRFGGLAVSRTVPAFAARRSAESGSPDGHP
ncbi:MAG: phenylacetic acid degradation operon negative regulatory protein PaaX [Sinobacteraceae bacterium]|nr:phenylacetic acid degradation operon negative regulatory protein PaaX [Nevskiaceae bacterium]